MNPFLRSVSRYTFVSLIFLVAWSGVQAEYSKTFTFTGESLNVENMIGEIVIKGGGNEFAVKVNVRGADATDGVIQFKNDSKGLTVVFPVDKSKRYVYPEMENSSTSFSFRQGHNSVLGSILGAITGSDRIQVSRSGSGLKVWADIEITVPAGHSLVVKHGVGTISADDVQGSLLLDASSGTVTASRIDGDVNVDTGSGDVFLDQINGEVLVDTGSGDVTLERIEASRLVVDTGSGDVTAMDLLSSRVSIDTGSGDVKLGMIEMGHGKLEVDTGSGRITILLPDDTSATVTADTGSGGIEYELTGDIDVRYRDRSELRMVVGGGSARINLDAGSGRISLRNSGSY